MLWCLPRHGAVRRWTRARTSQHEPSRARALPAPPQTPHASTPAASSQHAPAASSAPAVSQHDPWRSTVPLAQHAPSAARTPARHAADGTSHTDPVHPAEHRHAPPAQCPRPLQPRWSCGTWQNGHAGQAWAATAAGAAARAAPHTASASASGTTVPFAYLHAYPPNEYIGATSALQLPPRSYKAKCPRPEFGSLKHRITSAGSRLAAHSLLKMTRTGPQQYDSVTLNCDARNFINYIQQVRGLVSPPSAGG